MVSLHTGFPAILTLISSHSGNLSWLVSLVHPSLHYTAIYSSLALSLSRPAHQVMLQFRPFLPLVYLLNFELIVNSYLLFLVLLIGELTTTRFVMPSLNSDKS